MAVEDLAQAWVNPNAVAGAWAAVRETTGAEVAINEDGPRVSNIAAK